MRRILCKFGIHQYRQIMISTLWSPRIFVDCCKNCGKEKRK